MSKSKNRIRANQFLYRNGVRIPRHKWDEQQRLLKEANENKRLKKVGLVRGLPVLISPEEYIKRRIRRR